MQSTLHTQRSGTPPAGVDAKHAHAREKGGRERKREGAYENGGSGGKAVCVHFTLTSLLTRSLSPPFSLSASRRACLLILCIYLYFFLSTSRRVFFFTDKEIEKEERKSGRVTRHVHVCVGANAVCMHFRARIHR